MAGEAGKQRTALLATEKAFAAEAVTKIEAAFKEAGYKLEKLENYKEKADLHKAIADVDAVIIRSDIIDADALAAASKLKIVVRAGAGYDNIDLKACEGKGVCAMNTPGQNANAVAELVFGMMLTSARNNYDGSSGTELVNRELAFYGFGAVARAVHKIAAGFGMKSFAYDPFVSKEAIIAAGATPIDTVAELFKHQYVSLHCPLTPQTKESINKSLLSTMPKGVDFNLILTAVAFKLILTDMLPRVSYVTLLDFYVMGGFFFLTLVTVCHTILPSVYVEMSVMNSPMSLPSPFTLDEELDLIDADLLAFRIFLVAWVAFNLVYVIYFVVHQRNAYRSTVQTALKEQVQFDASHDEQIKVAASAGSGAAARAVLGLSVSK